MEAWLNEFAGEHKLNISAEDISPLRERYSAVVSKNSLPESALILGASCENLSTAFFCGYQLAVRHLDQSLNSDQFGAFCASESGISSSRNYQTKTDFIDGKHYLNGRKSHVMLMERKVVDYLYVLANDSLGRLVCVKVESHSSAIDVVPSSKPQPFVKEVPHTPVVFKQAGCIADFFIEDAHRRCNKPFRYWEDMMVGLAYAGWMLSSLAYNERQALRTSVLNLKQAYRHNTSYYSIESLDLLTRHIATLESGSHLLPEALRLQWNQDRALLMLGQQARDKIKRSLG